MRRVAILCGGPGSEHEISCLSAAGVLSAIDRNEYEPFLIGITPEGKWMALPLDYPLSLENGTLPSVSGNFPEVTRGKNGMSVGGALLAIDVIFPVLHGTYGEDGQLQSDLDQLGIAYVGSGAVASEQAMDKSDAKKFFSSAGIAIAPSVTVTEVEWKRNPEAITQSIKPLGMPVFVKASRGGSSRGTVKVKELSAFAFAMEEALSFDSKVLIESAIDGAEVECAVLEIDGIAQASTPGKVWIDPAYEFYDYQAKYLDGATRIDIPAPFSAEIIEKIQKLALIAFKAIGAKGLARVDFFVTPGGEIIINEINTMPGFTRTSAYPKMWAASGIGYTEVITHLLQSALAR
ncbi:D-alanine--D-alanine ligase family protein [Candidatus Planktophila dulcis]|uniref:D-alanine--D-alanine ligase family protein n=1 Tax=Candidatus Planktophila dulcis TaxID=1884914 RepID=UPI003CEFF83B